MSRWDEVVQTEYQHSEGRFLWEQMQQLFITLAERPGDDGIQSGLLSISMNEPHEFSQRIYERCLGMLPQYPQLKPFALELGRCHYGYLREGGLLTAYDEQAIQNDILANSG